jgi:hypothetical protein
MIYKPQFNSYRVNHAIIVVASLFLLVTSCSKGDDSGVRFFGSSSSEKPLDAVVGGGAVLRNLPANPSNQKKLDVIVGGRSVTHYIFALVDASESCDAAKYSGRRGIETHVTEDISGDGVKRLCVKGAGEGLAYQTKPTEYSWEFDGTPPGSFDFVGLRSPAQKAPPSVKWTESSGANRYRFLVSSRSSCDPKDGVIIPSDTLEAALEDLSEGLHYLCLTSSDLAGNSIAATSSPYPLSIDKTAPGHFHIFRPLAVTNEQAPKISWSSAVGAVNYDMTLSANQNCQSKIEGTSSPQTNFAVSKILADGPYYICLSASDAVGNNISADNNGYRFVIDTKSPLVSFENLPSEYSNVTTLGIGVKSTAPDFHSFRYKIINGTSDCAQTGAYGQEVSADTIIGDSISSVADGLLRICVIARDVAGNWTPDDNAQSFTWRKDTKPPSLAATVPGLCGPVICPRGGKLTVGPVDALDAGGSGVASVLLKLKAPDGRCLRQDRAGFEVCSAASFLTLAGNVSIISYDIFHDLNLSGAYEFTLKSVDQAGNQKTIIMPMVWDGDSPVFSSNDGVTISTRENPNQYLAAPPATKVNFLNVKLNANDLNSDIAKYCLKYVSSSSPSAFLAPQVSDGCWKGIPKANQSKALSLGNLPLTVSFFPDTYKVFAWVMDGADNMSAISNFASVKYNPIKPPVFSHVYATYTPDDELPKPGNTMAPANGSRDLYLRWAVSTGNPSGLKDLTLSYSLDDKIYVDAAVPGFRPDARVPSTCKLSAVNNSAAKAYAGCIKFTLPSAVNNRNFLRFRITAEDNDGYITFAQTNALHLDKFTFLAGNTEAGIGSTALSAIINPKGTQSLAVHSSGQIFILDDRGLLVVDPLDGALKVHPKSPNFPNATKIALDRNGDLIVLDGATIKKMDLSSTSQTVTTIAGGGSDTSNSIANPINLRIFPSSDQIFFAAPNGDIYFMSESYTSRQANDPMRVRRAVYARNYAIESLTINGSAPLFTSRLADQGPSGNYNVSDCRLISTAFTFNALGDPTGMFPLITPSAQTADISPCWLNIPANPFSQFHGYVPFRYSGSAGLQMDLSAKAPPFLVSWGGVRSGVREGVYARYFQSLSGKLFARVNGIRENNDVVVLFDPVRNEWVPIAGQESGGECVDGTLASDCALNLSAIFVDLNDRVYMMDNDVIRVIQDDGRILTIAGETRSAGDGKNPLNARFNVLTAFDIYPKDSAQTKFVISDAQTMRIREFAENGVMDSVAGNGISAFESDLTAPAKDHSIYWGEDGPNSGLAVDDQGNILVIKFQGQIPYRINRSTGKWESLTGSTTLPTIGGGYGAHVLGMNGSELLFGTFNYLREKLTSGNGRLYITPVSATAPKNLTPVLSKPNAGDPLNPQYQYQFDRNNMVCAQGTARNDCNGPYSTSAELPQATFDAEKNTWLLGVNNLRSSRVIGFQVTADPSMDKVQDLLTFPSNRILSFTVAGSIAANNKRAYVCLDSGKLYKYTISNAGISAGAVVPFPVAGMVCSGAGRSMIYSAARRASEGGTLIFIYELNGLQGIAEMVNP